MADKVFAGMKIRNLRTRHGMSQSQAARELGISPSYLNLIEHDQRPLTVPLLFKLARIFDVEVHALSDEEDARTVADLQEVFADEMFEGLEISDTDLKSLASTLPNVAGAIHDLYEDRNNARETVTVFGEMLSESALGEKSVFDLRTLMTTVLSFSEILVDNQDLSTSDRQRFVSILAEETRKLSDHIETFLETSSEELPTGANVDSRPGTSFDSILEQNGNFLADLEDAAETFRRELEVISPHIGEALAIYHSTKFAHPADNLECDSGLAKDFPGNVSQPLTVVGPPSGSASFALAERIALIERLDEMAAYMPEVAEEGGPVKDPALLSALAHYFASAVLLPYDPFLAAAEAEGYDIDRLARQFGSTFAQIGFRLATLRKPNASGLPFHLVEVDIAGNIVKRMSGSGLRIPRTGGVCPRWNVHAAFLSPASLSLQWADHLDGKRYLCLARAQIDGSAGHGVPVMATATAIGCDASLADKTVYGQDVDIGRPAVPVGSSCRTCTRTDCRQRAAPAVFPSAAQQGIH